MKFVFTLILFLLSSPLILVAKPCFSSLQHLASDGSEIQVVTDVYMKLIKSIGNEVLNPELIAEIVHKGDPFQVPVGAKLESSSLSNGLVELKNILHDKFGQDLTRINLALIEELKKSIQIRVSTEQKQNDRALIEDIKTRQVEWNQNKIRRTALTPDGKILLATRPSFNKKWEQVLTLALLSNPENTIDDPNVSHFPRQTILFSKDGTRVYRGVNDMSGDIAFNPIGKQSGSLSSWNEALDGTDWDNFTKIKERMPPGKFETKSMILNADGSKLIAQVKDTSLLEYRIARDNTNLKLISAFHELKKPIIDMHYFSDDRLGVLQGDTFKVLNQNRNEIDIKKQFDEKHLPSQFVISENEQVVLTLRKDGTQIDRWDSKTMQSLGSLPIPAKTGESYQMIEMAKLSNSLVVNVFDKEKKQAMIWLYPKISDGQSVYEYDPQTSLQLSSLSVAAETNQVALTSWRARKSFIFDFTALKGLEK